MTYIAAHLPATSAYILPLNILRYLIWKQITLITKRRGTLLLVLLWRDYLELNISFYASRHIGLVGATSSKMTLKPQPPDLLMMMGQS